MNDAETAQALLEDLCTLCPPGESCPCPHSYEDKIVGALREARRQGAADMKERCAKVAEVTGYSDLFNAGTEIAAAIRSMEDDDVG